MKTVNIEYKNRDHLKIEFSKIIFSLISNNILVSIFSGDFNRKIILELTSLIKEYIPNGIIVGATSTNGEFIDKKTLSGSIVISISYFENSIVKLAKTTKCKENSFSAGKELAKELHSDDLKIAILFAEGIKTNADDFLDGFSYYSKDDIYIAGGLSGDDYKDKETYIFYENEVLSSGAVGVGIYSKKLQIDMRYSFDWDVIGKEFIVEKAYKNVLKRIDGMTPEKLYTKYFGKNFKKHKNLIPNSFPLIFERNGFKTSNVLKYIDQFGFFHYNASLKENEKVSFSIPNKDKIIKNSVNLYNDMPNNLENIFIFSSGTRKMVLEDDTMLNETKYFSNLSSVSGLFTYGQFYKKPFEKAVFLQQAFTMVCLSEKTDENAKRKRTIRSKEFNVYEALHYLVNEVTQENKNITQNLNNLVRYKTKQLKNKNEALKKELYFDSLTKLKNRKSLIKDKKIINPRAVYLMDIQSFKKINNIYGEDSGDILLKKVAEYVNNYLINFSSEVYRLHGNTFAVLGTKKFDKNTYYKMTKQFIKDLESYDFSFEYDGAIIDFPIHIKIGIATILSSSSENLLEHADMALNYAKKTNQDFVIYNSFLEIEESYEKDLQTLKLIKEALAEDRIVPYFQAIHRGDFISYESLIRLKLKDGTILSPYYFLDVAKSTKLYYQLTQKMIEKTFEIFHNLPYDFSINLSYLDIRNTSTIFYIKKMLKKYDVAHRLTIEIVENETFENYDTVIDFIQELKQMNIKIAIDDFGSGYSNFAHLLKLDPDYVKIDGSLIKDIDINEKSLAVTKAIVSFSRDMNITTIAEFIHSQSVYDKANDINVDAYQGFLLSEPKSAEEIFK